MRTGSAHAGMLKLTVASLALTADALVVSPAGGASAQVARASVPTMAQESYSSTQKSKLSKTQQKFKERRLDALVTGTK